MLPEKSSVDVVKRMKQAFMLGCLVPKPQGGTWVMGQNSVKWFAVSLGLSFALNT